MRTLRNDPGTSLALEPEAPILGSRVGWVAGWKPGQGLLVDFEGNRQGPLPARLTLPLDAREVQAAVAARQGAVLLFENGNPSLPLLMGLIHPVSDTPLLDEVLGTTAPEPALPRPVEARVDGRRVVLEGRDEIVLKCGEASITLRRNGKVVIRGTQLETTATGVHRIKGGSVQIN